MVEEHSRALNLDKITSKLMLSSGSKNNNSRGTIEEIIRVKKGLNHLKDQMLHFMSKNKIILNLHEKKFYDIENFQANTIVFQTNTNASLKNLEMQIGQLDQAVQKEPKDSFQSDTRKNPKDCTTVIFRSGRALDERRVEKRDIEEEKQAEIGKELEQHSSKNTEKEKTEMQPKQQGKKEEVKAYNPLVPFP